MKSMRPMQYGQA